MSRQEGVTIVRNDDFYEIPEGVINKTIDLLLFMSNAPISTVSLTARVRVDGLCRPCKHNEDSERKVIQENSVVF